LRKFINPAFSETMLAYGVTFQEDGIQEGKWVKKKEEEIWKSWSKFIGSSFSPALSCNFIGGVPKNTEMLGKPAKENKLGHKMASDRHQLNPDGPLTQSLKPKRFQDGGYWVV
jgi:hypothetical protein